MAELTIEVVRAAVTGTAAAFRSVTRLQPAGGANDKVFPPTYATEKGTSRYAREDRRKGDEVVSSVLLDSVASQANRMELALLDGYRRGELAFPLLEIDFSKTSVADLDRITSLEAPHRAADALFRDSILGGKLFRLSDEGKAVTESRPLAATGLYRLCPTALVFGMWDSTGPKGGLGAKYPRCLVSEIVALGVAHGVKVGGRLDPAGIQKAGQEIYRHRDAEQEWTTDAGEAVQAGKGKPEPFKRKGGASGDAGTPAAINHGNVAPSIDGLAGGVTFDEAVQTTVLSLPGLRRLRFVTDTRGASFGDPAERRAAEEAARVALAALALAAVAYHRAEGYDLRSRSLLVPEGPLALELVPGDGSAPETYELSPARSAAILKEAAAAAKQAGMGWAEEPIVLAPAPKLVKIIERSRERAHAGEMDEA